MRKILVGSAVLAILIGFASLAHQTSSQTLEQIFLLAVAGAIGAAYLVHHLRRQRRLQTWNRTAGRIDTCFKGAIDEGTQEYTCAYSYSVEGTRQGGSFTFLDRPGRLDEIQAALVGEVIWVMYDPREHTKSIVEQSRIKNWDTA
jgi:hypothetical protein